MTQEEKNKILFEALSQYLPSKLICHISDGENVDVDRVLTGVTFNGCYFDGSGAFYGWNSFEIKPYLRPMLSMTEEERCELQEILGPDIEIENGLIDILDSSIHTFSLLELQAIFDWLNAHHFDYRGLIPMGLAIEVTEKNNPYKD